MSLQADQNRTKRQFWAAPGSRHDRWVRILRVTLPSFIGMLLAILAFAPFSNNREMSFVLAKEGVDLAKERMRLTQALYRGTDSKGRPFALKAGSAVQFKSSDPVLRLEDLSADLQMADGPATMIAGTGQYDMKTEIVTMRNLSAKLTMDRNPTFISAGQGQYDMKADTVRSNGPMSFSNSTGFQITANDVLFRIKSRQLESMGAVNGRTRIGTFRAGKMKVDVRGRVIRLENGAHLQIN